MSVTKKQYKVITGRVAALSNNNVTTTVVTLTNPGNGYVVMWRAFCTSYDLNGSSSSTAFGGGLKGGAGSAAFITSGTSSPQTLRTLKQNCTVPPTWAVSIVSNDMVVRITNPIANNVALDAIVVLEYTLVSNV